MVRRRRLGVGGGWGWGPVTGAMILLLLAAAVSPAVGAAQDRGPRELDPFCREHSCYAVLGCAAAMAIAATPDCICPHSIPLFPLHLAFDSERPAVPHTAPNRSHRCADTN